LWSIMSLARYLSSAARCPSLTAAMTPR
jgi:hypothetical protein